MTSFSSIADVFAYSEERRKGNLQLLIGTIKPSEKSETVLFGPVNSDAWISIASSAIIEIRYLGEKKSNADGAAYPYVQLCVRLSELQEASYLKAIGELTKELQATNRNRQLRNRIVRFRPFDGYITPHIYNSSDPSTSYSTFQVRDNLTGAVTTSPPVYGSQSWPFQCYSEDPDGGDVNVINLQSGVPNHFQYVYDGEQLTM